MLGEVCEGCGGVCVCVCVCVGWILYLRGSQLSVSSRRVNIFLPQDEHATHCDSQYEETHNIFVKKNQKSQLLRNIFVFVKTEEVQFFQGPF